MEELDSFHANALPDFFRHLEEPARPLQWLIDTLENPESLLIVAEEGGTIIGYLWAQVRQNPPLPMFVSRRWLMIEAIGVTEAYRGIGIGQALMQYAHDWARARDLAEIELTVWEFNREAIKFYQELGYTTIMRRLRKTL
jgi:GNAT superfamily N-acetyltransferase